MTNRERLKLALFTQGIDITGEARAALAERWGREDLTTGDYATTNGVILRFGGGDEEIWVNAPIGDFNPNFVTAPDHYLAFEDGGFSVVSPLGTFAAEPVPVPAYQGMLNPWDEPYTRYVNTHADRVRLSPIEGCAYTCTFCDVPYASRYRLSSIDRMMEALAKAVDDPVMPPRHVLISGGTPKPQDYGYLNEVYAAVCSTVPDKPVDVMMLPAPGLLDLGALRKMGVHGLSINLEVFDDAVARKVAPRKHGLTKDLYLDFIEEAVEVFGTGRVRSLLLVGLEDVEATLDGVEALAARGCDPVLSPFRPDPATPLRDRQPLGADALADIVEWARERIEPYNNVVLGPRCRACGHNAVP